MNRATTISAGIAVLLAGVLIGQAIAGGAPKQTPLTWSGVVTDTAGKPYTQAVDVKVAFFDKATGGSAKCTSSTVKAQASTGRFSVVLPADCAKAVMATTDLWVQAWVGPKNMAMARQHVGAVPYALTTDTAAIATKSLDVQCVGCVSVGELSIDKDLDLKGKGLKAGVVTATKVDFGPGAKDELTAAQVKTLVGGGNADALHTHAGSGSSSGGGGQLIKFKGVTSGAITITSSGGLAAIDAVCAKQFSGSRMCTSESLDAIYPRVLPKKEAWILVTGPWLYPSGGYMYAMVGGRRLNLQLTNCNGGSADRFAFSRASANKGTTLLPSGNYNIARNCKEQLPAACCGP